METLKIKWLYDPAYECGHNGCSGGFDSYGAIVWAKGKEIIRCIPSSYCCGPISWEKKKFINKF